MKNYLLAITALSLFNNGFTQLGKAFRDSLLSGISSNNVQVVFVDTFTTTSLDLTGSPRDISKWTKSNHTGTPGNPTINNSSRYTVGSYINRGYEWGSQAFLRQQLGFNQGVYLWSPVITFPDIDNLYAKFALRSAGFDHLLAGDFTIGFAFDGDNDQVPDATPPQKQTIFNGTGPYGDYASGAFFPNSMGNIRHVFLDLSGFRNQTGRIGILLKQTGSGPTTFDLDWFVVGSRPSNDLCANAIQLKEGYNGGTRGYYNSTATGLISSTNSTPGNNQGGATIYVGEAPNGTGAIPSDGTYKDGYQPNNPGPFGSKSATVENSIWFKFVTPMIANCSGGSLSMRITARDLDCASNSTPTPRRLQFRVFNSSTCGTNTAHDFVAISTLSELVNNGNIVATGLSYNTTYYVAVDGVNTSDCKFRLQAETLVDNVVQTSPCVLQSPTPMAIELLDFQEKCYENTSEISWVTAKNIPSSFEVQASNSFQEWNKLGEVQFEENQSNFTFTYPKGKFLYYRLKQIDIDGMEQYSSVLTSSCVQNLDLISISPNPATDLVTLKNLPFDSKIKVFDSRGSIVYSSNSQSVEQNIPLKHLQDGVYLIHIHTETQSRTYKIVKQ